MSSLVVQSTYNTHQRLELPRQALLAEMIDLSRFFFKIRTLLIHLELLYFFLFQFNRIEICQSATTLRGGCCYRRKE